MAGFVENIDNETIELNKINEILKNIENFKRLKLSNQINEQLSQKYRINMNYLSSYFTLLNLNKYDGESDYYYDFIYHIDIHLVQKDTEITDLLYSYDKDFVRESYPPCIYIMFHDKNYDKLSELLKNKYNITDFYKSKRVYNRTNKSYEELKNAIIEHNNCIKYYESDGAIEFVKQKSIPFTKEFYEDLVSL